MKRTPMKRTPMRRPAPMLGQTPEQARISRTWPFEYMTEKKFQAEVEQTAADLGWMASHSHLPFFDTAGWPDLAMVHPVKKRFMVRELKVTSAKGKVPSPSPLQWRWLSALTEAGIDTGVWTYPQDALRYVEELSA